MLYDIRVWIDPQDCPRGPLLARLAQSVEHETLNLRVVGSSPTLGAQSLLYQFELKTLCVVWRP